MKKATKILITAAAVAAVAGVSAVSFAAWAGGSNTTQVVGGTTGQIKTIGDIVVTPTAASGSVSTTDGVKTYTMKNLCPVDQSDATKPADCVTYWEFALSSATTGEGTTVKYTILGSIGAGSSDSATANTAKLKWSTTTPSKDGGTVVSSEAADISGTKVYVYLVADNTDGMNATVSVTFGVVDATPAA